MSWVCKKCGKSNRDDIHNCLYCNAKNSQRSTLAKNNLAQESNLTNNKTIPKKKKSKINAITAIIAVGSITILIMIAFLIKLIIQIDSPQITKNKTQTTQTNKTNRNAGIPPADTYIPAKPKQKNNAQNNRRKTNYKTEYDKLMDNCFKLMESKYFDYYIKLNIVSQNDKVTILNLIEKNVDNPNKEQYMQLEAIHDKLTQKDIFYYHIAKINYINKDFKSALQNLNNLETKFPDSPLIRKADLLLTKILKK